MTKVRTAGGPAATSNDDGLKVMFLAAATRLFLEAFRGDIVITSGLLRAAQLLSLVILTGTMAGLHLRARAAFAEEDRPIT